MAFYTEGGIRVDPNDGAFDREATYDEPFGPEGKPIVYLFSNAWDGDGIAYAMAEDGTVLGSHLCSHVGYMYHDLFERRDQGAAMREHYPDGFRLCIMSAGKTIPPEVYDRNQELGRQMDAEKARVQAESDTVADPEPKD